MLRIPSLSSTTRRVLLVCGAALIVSGGAAGLVLAQQQPPTPQPGSTPPGQTARPTYQAFLDALAKRLNISTNQLQQAIADARKDVGLPPEGPKGGIGFGHFGHHGWFGGDLSAAAQAIGISVDQLRRELPGKSLAQVAQAHGKSANDVVTALKNAANQRIDQAVAAGRLTAQQANQIKQQLDQRIQQKVNMVTPQQGRWGSRPARTPGTSGQPA